MSRKRHRSTWERELRRRGPRTSLTRHVCLVIATYADDDGTGAIPHIETIAESAAMGRRATIEHVNNAIECGWLHRDLIDNPKDGRAWRLSRYTLTIPPEAGAAHAPAIARKVVHYVHHETKKVVHLTTKGGASDDKKVVHQVHPTVVKAQKRIQGTREQASRAVVPKGGYTFREYQARCSQRGEQFIPLEDAVFRYAERAGIPHEWVQLAWRKFQDQYRDNGRKRHRDWRAAFRGCVRGNWYGLWAAKDGTMFLTPTKGKVAERAYADAH